jgi:hypothetical protein
MPIADFQKLLLDYAPFVIAIFSCLYWYLDSILRARLFTRQQAEDIIHPADRHNGALIGIFIVVTLWPIYYFFPDDGFLIVLLSGAVPLLATLLLGLRRKHVPISALLILSAHGAGVALLYMVDGLSSVGSCISQITELDADQRLSAISICAEMSRFWFNFWLTMSLAIITAFAGGLASLFLSKPVDYARSAEPTIGILRKERKVLATLYSVSIIWMLLLGFASVGVPSILYLKRIVDVKPLLTSPGPTPYRTPA